MKKNGSIGIKRMLPAICAAACALTIAVLATAVQPVLTGSAPPSVTAAATYRLTRQDRELLKDLTARLFCFFSEHADPRTGLIKDRAHADGSPYEHPVFASMAATGFGLTAVSIAPDHGWLTPAKARERVRKTLRFLAEKSPHKHGWFYHFVDPGTGERYGSSEVSSIDTALLLCGVLAARARFSDDEEIVRLADKIYKRVDFQWMLNGDPFLLSHGWKPESGFIKYRWDTYSEDTVLYLLAIGSNGRSIPAESWYAWKRPSVTFDGYTYISGGSLFTHQYSQAWVDYRDLREARPPHTDYFENSIAATRANRAFCISLSDRFPGYSANVWGITASDSVKGYVGWGGPPFNPSIDGTVVPSAAGGSLMFTPDICLPALRTMLRRFGKKIYSRYGFVDAFNPNTGWVDPDVVGIDVGITLLSAANLMDGGVWRWFMQTPEIIRAMDSVGFEKKQQRMAGSNARIKVPITGDSLRAIH